MLYAIIGQFVPDSLERRMAARPAHVARLHALQDEGRLILAGPFPAVEEAIQPRDMGGVGNLREPVGYQRSEVDDAHDEAAEPLNIHLNFDVVPAPIEQLGLATFELNEGRAVVLGEEAIAYSQH